MAVPKYYELFNPLLQALRELGGSASIPEQEEAVARLLSLSEDDVNEIHRGNRTKFGYKLGWARTYLKRYGLLENSDRGVWALTEDGTSVDRVVPEEVVRMVQQQGRVAREELAEAEAEQETPEMVAELRWQDAALQALREMAPDAFERLCQRLLRESGFIQVEVTGRSGDGGIDGKGVVKLGGILSFHVSFQCKRYQGSVSSGAIRDFRGAMVGRADKGLFITTGTFTRDARAEAQRDGAPPLDMIDGDELVVMLKDLRLGIDVRSRTVEEVSVNREWFQKI
ncbi:restriction system protein [Terrimicrobium sacchariphilum]|uniref:Restriction system protein n=1 Tax=Terrimicrobium sacchariphilum TaxID=690879 RepID=A0A146G6S8_TERSA|nr:restriction endonuclease [Terrimicrobium sacchariphilum]GAT32478.1 restriction system protein [Terrimicrobium sacchariphilum]